MHLLLEFNVFPISVNKLYSTRFGQRRRFLTTEGKKFKDTINEKVAIALADGNLHRLVSSFIGKPLEVTIDVYSSSWLLKDQERIRIKDIGNIEKALLDAVFTAFKDLNFDVDDSQIWNLTLKKHFTADHDRTVVTMQLFEGEV